MAGVLAEALNDWREQTRGNRGVWVFPSEKVEGQPIDRSAIRRHWSAVKEAGGLPSELELYSLRHHFASQLIAGGADLLSVSRLLGHTNIQTTVNNYAHLLPDHAAWLIGSFEKAALSNRESGNDGSLHL